VPCQQTRGRIERVLQLRALKLMIIRAHTKCKPGVDTKVKELKRKAQ
jgi:hypothetical protein